MRKINQSTIKRLNSRIICPQKYYRQEVTKEFVRPTTDAMMKGNYGEYKAFGTMPKSGDGSIPMIPRHKKTGKPSVAEIRIDAQVQKMFQIFEEQGMTVAKKDFYCESKVGNIILFGTKDVLLDWNGKPYIFDMKICSDVTSEFGKFAWGGYKHKHPLVTSKIPGGAFYMAHYNKVEIEKGNIQDPLQAHAYMLNMEIKTGVPWGFIYGVFDYKKNPEWKFIEVPFSRDAREDALVRLRDTDYKLEYFEKTNYEEIPHLDECSDCPVWNCARRIHDVGDSDPGSEITFYEQPETLPDLEIDSQRVDEEPLF